MSDHCQKCAGLIIKPGVNYNYSGLICHCTRISSFVAIDKQFYEAITSERDALKAELNQTRIVNENVLAKRYKIQAAALTQKVAELTEKYQNLELANKQLTRNDHVNFGELLKKVSELEAEVTRIEKDRDKIYILGIKLEKQNAEIKSALASKIETSRGLSDTIIDLMKERDQWRISKTDRGGEVTLLEQILAVPIDSEEWADIFNQVNERHWNTKPAVDDDYFRYAKLLAAVLARDVPDLIIATGVIVNEVFRVIEKHSDAATAELHVGDHKLYFKLSTSKDALDNLQRQLANTVMVKAREEKQIGDEG